jgi:hypothetical protein
MDRKIRGEPGVLLPATSNTIRSGSDKKILALPEGIAQLPNFAGSPEGQKTILSVPLRIIRSFNLPHGAADMIKGPLVPPNYVFPRLSEGELQ